MNDEVGITFSGNIISELSEKIPNNIIAINELIKNSYDAGATYVNISLDSKNKALSVEDDGKGMDLKDIRKLFHISFSDKEYGKEFRVNNSDNNRFVQGSKGLGFLSVFKFGKEVNWETNKNEILKFSANFDELVNLDDTSNYHLLVDKMGKDKNNHGTKIRIAIDDYNFKILKEYFENEINSKKIVNSFLIDNINWVGNNENPSLKIDNDFIISLLIDGDIVQTTNEIDIQNESKNSQLLRVKYDSLNKKICFYNNNIFIYELDFQLSSDKYNLNTDIQIFSFKKGGKQKINRLFFNPESFAITPLVYVNDNLFNNYSIFNASAMREVKSGLSLPQMIGFISITSDSSNIRFNSDRTKFSQNYLTDDIIKDITNLNKKIQITGSELKNELKFSGFSKILKNIDEIKNGKIKDEKSALDLINDNFKLKKYVSCEVTENYLDYKLFNNSKRILKNNKISHIDNSIKQENSPSINTSSLSSNNHSTNLDDINNEPNIKQIQFSVEINKENKIDDLAEIYNSKNEKDVGLEPSINLNNDNSINLNKVKGTLTFFVTGKHSIIYTVKDKKNQKTIKKELFFKVNNSSFNKIKNPSKSKEEFIRLPVSKGNNLPNEIRQFIKELNELFLNYNYQYTFVSSVRTLVELVVDDILDKRDLPKEAMLKRNYDKVISDLSYFNELVESKYDASDKQTLESYGKSIATDKEKKAFMASLNLSTHGSKKLISKTSLKDKTYIQIQILLEYLELLNEK